MNAAPTSAEDDSEPAVVFLVHGTRFFWQQRSKNYDYVPWAPTVQAIETAFRGRVRFEPFWWTGYNSHSARREATTELSQELTVSLEARPKSNHYIVAHSHGGNIAIAAAARVKLPNAVCAIACLATPFVSVSARSSTLVPRAALYGCWNAGVASFLAFNNRAILDGRIAFLVIITITLALFWCGLTLERHATRVRQQLVPCPIDRDCLLVMRHPLDEASWALAIGQGTRFVAQKINFLTDRFWQSLEAPRRFVTLSAAAVLALAILVVPQFVAAGVAEDAVRFSWFLLVAVYSALALPSVVVAAFLVASVFVSCWVLGLELAVTGPFMELAIEASPEGEHVVRQMPKTSDRIQHSEAYRSPQAAQHIAEWFATRRVPIHDD